MTYVYNQRNETDATELKTELLIYASLLNGVGKDVRNGNDSLIKSACKA